MLYSVIPSKLSVYTGSAYVQIPHITSFEISYNGNVVSWYELGNIVEQSMKTGLAPEIALEGKADTTDTALSAILDTRDKVGAECEMDFKIEYPDGTTVNYFSAMVNIETFGGAAEDVIGFSGNLKLKTLETTTDPHKP